MDAETSLSMTGLQMIDDGPPSIPEAPGRTEFDESVAKDLAPIDIDDADATAVQAESSQGPASVPPGLGSTRPRACEPVGSSTSPTTCPRSATSR